MHKILLAFALLAFNSCFGGFDRTHNHLPMTPHAINPELLKAGGKELVDRALAKYGIAGYFKRESVELMPTKDGFEVMVRPPHEVVDALAAKIDDRNSKVAWSTGLGLFIVGLIAACELVPSEATRGMTPDQYAIGPAMLVNLGAFLGGAAAAGLTNWFYERDMRLHGNTGVVLVGLSRDLRARAQKLNIPAFVADAQNGFEVL